ncbi:hemolysin family protein [Singulisphaera sp. Ch08]|uniref:Hemolysin family protein n=1 Tax=Singulisphaera sp. Ch08 TaxID=3120278 RepID=A0AAU7C6I2_9BACT
MSTALIEVCFILLLIVASGIFAMSEMAIVASRKARLRQWAEEGNRRARIALEMADDPNRSLATVQVGITMVGTLAGVFGGATIAESIADRLEQVPRLAPYGESIGLAVVVAGIAYVSMVIGELVPKRLALSNPERIASIVAGPLRLLSVVGVPIVRLLSISTDLVLRLLGIQLSTSPTVTEEEIRALVKEGAKTGVLEEVEHEIVKRVFRLGDKRASALMTPRTEVIWIDVADSPDEVRRKITECPHSRFPVSDGTLDNVLGVVQVKDLLVRGYEGRPYDFKGLLIVPLLIYEGMTGLKVLEMFKNSGTHIALVLDEYGSVEGLLTLNDILEAIVGGMPSESEADDPMAVQRSDGTWLLDGMLSVDEFGDLFEPIQLPEGDYQTLAGFVVTKLGRIPTVADSFVWGELKFEVMDMDANRVDRLLVGRFDGRP